MSEGQAVVFAPDARADFSRRLLTAACAATGVAVRLEVFRSSGSLFARVTGRREGLRGDVLIGLGPYLAQAVAVQGAMERFQPPRVSDVAPHHAEWRWTALDASAWFSSPAVAGFDDLQDVPRLALLDPAHSEVGVMAVLASLDRARQAEGDPERALSWWQRRVRSGVVLADDEAGLKDPQASHALALGALDGGGPLPGLAPMPHAVGLLSGARNADSARKLLAWLVSPDAADAVTSAGGLSYWQSGANGLSNLLQAAPPLDVDWTYDQYRPTRARWLQQGFSPGR
jgi:ABC-type thiamine transport system substrate-binding protein